MTTVPSIESFQQMRMAMEAMPSRTTVVLVSPRGERYSVNRSTGDFYLLEGSSRFYFAAADMAYAVCRAMAREDAA